MRPPLAIAAARLSLAETLRPVLRTLGKRLSVPEHHGFQLRGPLLGGRTLGSAGICQVTVCRSAAVRHPDPDARALNDATEHATVLATAWCQHLADDAGADAFQGTLPATHSTPIAPQRRPAQLPQIGPLIRAACWTDPTIEWSRLSAVKVEISILPDPEDEPNAHSDDGFHASARLFGRDGIVRVSPERLSKDLRAALRPAMPAFRAAVAPVTTELNGGVYVWQVTEPSGHQRMEAARLLAATSD